MKTGFLIINYNDSETTLELINNIKNYKMVDMIVIIDNNSTDDSYIKLKKIETKKIKVIKSLENKGYGYGINFGSKYLIENCGDCNIVVSNPDIIIKNEDDLKKLINTFDKDTSIVAPLVNEHGNINRGWKVPSPMIDCLLNLVYINRILKTKLLSYNDNFYNNDIVEVEAVSGCFFIIKSNDLERVDFFDENLFLYYEENVISKKLQSIGKKVKLNTKVEILHNHSVSIDKSIKKIGKYKALKKSQFYFQKNYNRANIVEQLLLFLTNKLSLIILYFYYNIKQ